MLKASITMINRKEIFIEKAKVKHNEKYDYSKVNYVNNKTKVCIICPIHGEFWQQPRHHLSGSECPKCKGKNKTTEELINDFKKVHGDKYDYSKVHFVKTSQKVCVVCKTHGDFYITPNHHLQGVGCPKCGGSCRSTKEEFTERSNILYNYIYDYSLVDYVNANAKVYIGCPKHGYFWKTPSKHLNGQGCPKCAAILSKAENEIVTLLKPLDIETHNRTILNGKEVDIYVPSLKIGIEYNGLMWHSEAFGKNKHYHINKLEECHKQGVNLIQIFEDEWHNKKDICKSLLSNIFGLNNAEQISINDCNISELSNKYEIYNFLENNHINGVETFSNAIGMFYKNKLIGVMTFKRLKDNCVILKQIAFDIHYQCTNFEKSLFHFFITKYNFNKIIAIADRRWIVSDVSNIYTSLGFKINSYIKPSYTLHHWKYSHYNRYTEKELSKNELCEKFNFSLSNGKKQIIKKAKFNKIWDCGKVKYVYEKDPSR